jgi:hypothetical protein
MIGTDSSQHTALVDAHVHFHACFDTELFLGSARENFAAAASEAGIEPDFTAFLLLTESAGANWFSQLQEPASRGWKVCDLWTAHATSDDREVRIVHTSGMALHIVAGRQIVTAERLEVLALGNPYAVPDGYPLLETIQRVTELGAVPVIPWGFGKWLGKRGRKVHDVLAAATPGELFLGDNSGRLMGTRDPEQFVRARAKGISILPGTDPFPFPEQARRVGRMGFVVRSPHALSSWKQLRDAIVAREGISPYGEREQPLPFVMNQVAMQVVKHTARWRPSV